MSSDAIRPDLYRVFDRIGDWDSRMREQGFSSGHSYKKFLLELGGVDPTLESTYDFLTLEGWKEHSSEQIGWDNLPGHFDWQRLALPYRSSHLAGVHEKIAIFTGTWDLADIRSERWRLIFPYQKLVDQVRAAYGDLDKSFRGKLVSTVDDEALVFAARALGIEPIGRPVSSKAVKKVVEGFCQDRGLAKPSDVRPTKNGFVYGHDFGNDLVLCLSVLEVRSFLVEGKRWNRINSSFGLVRKGQFSTSWGWPKEFPWAGLPELSIYPSYGYKEDSPVAFYVNLGYILLSFQFWCEAFDSFFETSMPNNEGKPGF